jgi:hypothetical protein
MVVEFTITADFATFDLSAVPGLGQKQEALRKRCSSSLSFEAPTCKHNFGGPVHTRSVPHRDKAHIPEEHKVTRAQSEAAQDMRFQLPTPPQGRQHMTVQDLPDFCRIIGGLNPELPKDKVFFGRDEAHIPQKHKVTRAQAEARVQAEAY